MGNKGANKLVFRPLARQGRYPLEVMASTYYYQQCRRKHPKNAPPQEKGFDLCPCKSLTLTRTCILQLFVANQEMRMAETLP